jgi:hypothetical protein
MSKKTTVLLVLLLIILIGIAVASFKTYENKNMPIEQTISEAYITLEVAPLDRMSNNEDKIKNASKNKIKDIYYYKGKYRNIEYTVIFASYSREVETKSIIKAIETSLKDYNLSLKSTNNEVSGLEGILLEGSFNKDNKRYIIKEQTIKKNSMLWQILAVYPNSRKNNVLADKYLSSVRISVEEIKH